MFIYTNLDANFSELIEEALRGLLNSPLVCGKSPWRYGNNCLFVFRKMYCFAENVWPGRLVTQPAYIKC